MSKQINLVNFEPEILHGTGLLTRSIMKYNFFVNPFTSCKTDIIITLYIMQAVPVSKQVNRVNIKPEVLHGNWSSY